MTLVEDVLAANLISPEGIWRLHVSGCLDLVPNSTAHALKNAVDVTRDLDRHATLAIGCKVVTDDIGTAGKPAVLDHSCGATPPGCGCARLARVGRVDREGGA